MKQQTRNSKRPFSPPRIEVYGTIRELTEVQNCNNKVDDGGDGLGNVCDGGGGSGGSNKFSN